MAFGNPEFWVEVGSPNKALWFQHFTVYKGLSLLSLVQALRVPFCPDSEQVSCDGTV